MIRCGKKSKILAAVLAAGIILSMQGMTAFAGSTGVGAAKSAQTGPGVAAQNDSQTGQPEGVYPSGPGRFRPRPVQKPAVFQSHCQTPENCNGFSMGAMNFAQG